MSPVFQHLKYLGVHIETPFSLKPKWKFFWYFLCEQRCSLPPSPTGTQHNFRGWQ